MGQGRQTSRDEGCHDDDSKPPGNTRPSTGLLSVIAITMGFATLLYPEDRTIQEFGLQFRVLPCGV